MEDKNLLCERAQAFVREFFQLYLEKRDFAAVERMLDSEITWFGTGAHEICHNREQAAKLLEAERDSWNGYFRVEEYWSKAIAVDETCCNVYGAMQIKEDSENLILLEMQPRFSMLCKLRDGKLYLHHAHYSVPNAAQGDNEFVHGDLMENYNKRLEETLRERTAQLQATTQELESMANNIAGGLQICVANDEFTIRYISDGFLKLMGYAREELLNTSHTRLVHPGDVAFLGAQMLRQLELGNDFSVVYRVVRKDGEVRWVLDNGTLLPKTVSA